MSKRVTPATGLVAALFISGLAFAADNTRLQQDFDAGGVKKLSIDAAIGSVELTAADADQILVKVRLEYKDHRYSESDHGALDETILNNDLQNGALTLYLDLPPPGIDQDDLEAHWAVNVPARIASNVRIAVGNIEIQGVTGGVVQRPVWAA